MTNNYFVSHYIKNKYLIKNTLKIFCVFATITRNEMYFDSNIIIYNTIYFARRITCILLAVF
jgi:hypothetical protein